MRQWKCFLCLWICRADIDVVNIILPKTIYIFNAVPIKILIQCFTETKNSLMAKKIKQNTET